MASGPDARQSSTIQARHETRTRARNTVNRWANDLEPIPKIAELAQGRADGEGKALCDARRVRESEEPDLQPASRTHEEIILLGGLIAGLGQRDHGLYAKFVSLVRWHPHLAPITNIVSRHQPLPFG